MITFILAILEQDSNSTTKLNLNSTVISSISSRTNVQTPKKKHLFQAVSHQEKLFQNSLYWKLYWQILYASRLTTDSHFFVQKTNVCIRKVTWNLHCSIKPVPIPGLPKLPIAALLLQLTTYPKVLDLLTCLCILMGQLRPAVTGWGLFTWSGLPTDKHGR